MRLPQLLAGFILIASVSSRVPAQTSNFQPTPPVLANSESADSGNSANDAPLDLAATDSASPQSGTPATQSATNPANKPICGITHLLRCVQDLGEDDRGIFTSPLRMQPKDVYWLAPVGAATGLAFAYDVDAAQAVGVDPSRADTANKIAAFGSFYATGAEGAGIYFLGLAKKNPKLAETGRLGAEAVIGSGTVILVTKLVSNRQRPLQGTGQGHFWPNGTSSWEWDSSFPSDHATASMALARVIAGEYPHWYVLLPAYGFAESVSIARIMANQHFPSDVVVGQAIGFLTGTYVLNHRALYRPNNKKTLATKLLGSVNPIANPRERAVGASMEIPLGH